MRHVAFSRRLVTRTQIADQIENLIALLDMLDGDPDLEENDAEDSFSLSSRARSRDDTGPGCPISDPGGNPLELDGEGGDEYYSDQPLYGVDQSFGPINSAIAAQRHDLRGRLGWDSKYDKQAHAKLARLDEREAALPAVRGRA